MSRECRDDGPVATRLAFDGVPDDRTGFRPQRQGGSGDATGGREGRGLAGGLHLALQRHTFASRLVMAGVDYSRCNGSGAGER